MQVTRKMIEDKTNIQLFDDGKELSFSFAGNGDLYWTFYEFGVEDFNYGTFTITKENYQIYKAFDLLYRNISECKIFPCYNDLDSIDTNKLNEEIKRSDCYQELFDGESITWISDDRDFTHDSIVRISKKDETYLLEFTRKEKDNLDLGYMSFGLSKAISIRFRNSGSCYNPINVVFMLMYRELCTYDPDMHQIHIEELLYNHK